MTLTILTAAIFVASLQSFYIASLGGPIIPYIGGVLLVIVGFMTASLRSKSATIPVAGLYISLSFIGISIVGTFQTESYKSASGLIFGCAVFLATTATLREKPERLAIALKIVIVAHLALLLVQICWYYGAGSYLDYLHFTDDHAVWNSRKGWEIAGELVPRFTGAFNEPGTYSGVMGALGATYYFANRKVDLLLCTVIVTLVASAALTGAILAAALMSAIGWDYVQKLKGLAKISALATSALVTVAVAGFIFSRFTDRLQYTGGVEDAVFQNLAWLLDLENLSISGHAISNLPSYVSVEYFGVWMTTYIQFGLLGLLALMTLLAPALFANPALFGALLLAKVKITFPLIYILAAGIWVVSQKSAANRNDTESLANLDRQGDSGLNKDHPAR